MQQSPGRCRAEQSGPPNCSALHDSRSANPAHPDKLFLEGGRLNGDAFARIPWGSALFKCRGAPGQGFQ